MGRRAGTRAGARLTIAYRFNDLPNVGGTNYGSPESGTGVRSASTPSWVAPFDLWLTGIQFGSATGGSGTGPLQFYPRMTGPAGGAGTDYTGFSLTVASTATAGRADPTPQYVEKGSRIGCACLKGATSTFPTELSVQFEARAA